MGVKADLANDSLLCDVIVESGLPVPLSDGVVVSPASDGVLIRPRDGDFPSVERGMPEPDVDRKLNSPPIEGLDLLIREIWPSQYVTQVTSALPDGCSQFAGYTM